MRSETTGPTAPEELDHYHRALAHEWRRTVVSVLDRRPSATLSELAEAVVERTDEDSREQVEVGLWHTHVPLLVSVGAVDVDDWTIRRRQPTFDGLVAVYRRTTR